MVYGVYKNTQVKLHTYYSVHWISHCPHADQIFLSSPHHITDSRGLRCTTWRPIQERQGQERKHRWEMSNPYMLIGKPRNNLTVNAASMVAFYYNWTWKNFSLLSHFQGSLPLKMGLTGCPKMSVRNYHYLLRDNPEENSSLTWNKFGVMFTQ
jgi:hypothetical protein